MENLLEGKREHSCHTSIRPALGEPCACFACVDISSGKLRNICLEMYSCMLVLMHAYVYVHVCMTVLVCACVQMCVAACQALQRYHSAI